MDISTSSSLLHSRYSECVPLVHPLGRRGRGSHGCGQRDVAYLSSVQAPSELCLGLACVAWRRSVTARGNGDWFLVFVPFDEPREEIFVEIPIAAFEGSSLLPAGKRRRGLQLLLLNEYSLLLSHAKDGLPPRKGLFVTFRSTEAQQRFLGALDRAIRVCDVGELPNGDSAPLTWMNVDTSPDTKEDDDSMGAKLERGKVGAVAEVVSPVADGQQWTAIGASRDGVGVRDAASFIDRLLAERDRRRAAYMHNSVPSESLPKRGCQAGGSSFDEWARRHRVSHPQAWNALSGAVERQLETERRAQEGYNVATATGGKVCQERSVQLTHENAPSLEQREALLHEVRVAMEALDNMNEAQGHCSMSIMGAARDFLRQHQEDLWQSVRRESGATMQQSHPLISDEVVTGTTLSPALETESQLPPVYSNPHQQRGQAEERGSTREAAETVRSGTDADLPAALPPSQFQAWCAEPSLMPLDSKGSELGVTPRKVAAKTATVTGETKKEEENEELRRALEAESRILSSLQRAPPRPLATQRVFGRAPKMPLSSPSNQRENIASSFVDTEVKMLPVGSGTESGALGDGTPAGGERGISGGTVPPDVGGRTIMTTTARDASDGASPVWKGGDPPSPGAQTKKEEGEEGEEEGKVKRKKKEKEREKAVVCGAGWRAVSDPSSGRMYYVNKVTKATTWKVEETLAETCASPAADVHGVQAKEWAERKDPSTGKVYYYNKKTRQTTWKRSETDLEST